jgi:hypothetical protein
MHEENTRYTSGHTPPATTAEDIATRRTDPKFVRESFTMRRMHWWQIVALAVAAAAALVVGLVVIYF